MSHNIDVLYAFTNAYNDGMFCSNIKNDGDVDQIIRSLCSCNCCSRHMICRHDYDKIKLLFTNTDVSKTADIINTIEHETNYVNNTGSKFIFLNSFMNIESMISENDDIKSIDVAKLKDEVSLLIRSNNEMMNTISKPKENKLICNIFKMKIMTLLTCWIEQNNNNDKMSSELKELFGWAMDIYEASKEVNKELKTIECTCGCRSFVRSMLMVYGKDIDKNTQLVI